MGLVVSPRHPYLFSCSQDKEIKCWDLEQNRVIRNYHGHFSGVYSIALHPQLDILATGGRDCSVRLWDMRTRAQIHLFEGHRHSVASVQMQASEPQIISGSYDSTVRLWDIVAGRSRAVLTNHKKSVRSVLIHPREYAFASASADNVKIWKCPDGEFLRNCAGHNAVVNALAVNEDDVLVSCADNGTMFFWDWATGEPFQSLRSQPQPGSLDSEAGIFAATFDRSGIRLLTAETDKTIKVWREDETATPESHPVRAPDPAAKQSHF
jgi:pleiotropic regulator 1